MQWSLFRYFDVISTFCYLLTCSWAWEDPLTTLAEPVIPGIAFIPKQCMQKSLHASSSFNNRFITASLLQTPWTRSPPANANPAPELGDNQIGKIVSLWEKMLL